jgi:hypothetical protein
LRSLLPAQACPNDSPDWQWRARAANRAVEDPEKMKGNIRISFWFGEICMHVFMLLIVH